MKIDSTLLKKQLDYTYWASDRLLDAARPLSDEELSRDLKNSVGGVLDTLLHIFYADRIWLSRVAGSPRLTLQDPGESFTLNSLQSAWVDVHLGWIDWAGEVNDVEHVFEYRNLAGDAKQLALWELVFHLVNHGTYHRGQVTTMLRQLGHTPVSTDMHAYYQSLR